jgi:hypothetical protein
MEDNINVIPKKKEIFVFAKEKMQYQRWIAGKTTFRDDETSTCRTRLQTGETRNIFENIRILSLESNNIIRFVLTRSGTQVIKMALSVERTIVSRQTW